MKRTIELLKKAGVIDRIQKKITEIKPPKGTSDEEINNAIFTMLKTELLTNDELADSCIDAMWDDFTEEVRKQLNIEYVEAEEFDRQTKAILHSIVDMLFGK